MFRIGRVLGLVTLLGSLGPWGSPPALAQRTASRAAEREQFLGLLLRRQDQAMAQLLAQRKAQIEAQLERLERVPPRGPQQGRQLERLEQRLGQRAQMVERQITNPPASPLRRLLEQRAQALRWQAQQIEARLEWLGKLGPRDPRRARQIERVVELWQQQFRRTTEQVQFLDRLAASPVAPRNVVGAIGFQPRSSSLPRWWRARWSLLPRWWPGPLQGRPGRGGGNRYPISRVGAATPAQPDR